MKSEISKTEIVERNVYPCLKQAIEKGNLVIVLFFNHGEGTVVFSCSPTSPLGYYCDEWTESEFEFFKGELKLSNLAN